MRLLVPIFFAPLTLRCEWWSSSRVNHRLRVWHLQLLSPGNWWGSVVSNLPFSSVMVLSESNWPKKNWAECGLSRNLAPSGTPPHWACLRSPWKEVSRGRRGGGREREEGGGLPEEGERGGEEEEGLPRVGVGGRGLPEVGGGVGVSHEGEEERDLCGCVSPGWQGCGASRMGYGQVLPHQVCPEPTLAKQSLARQSSARKICPRKCWSVSVLSRSTLAQSNFSPLVGSIWPLARLWSGCQFCRLWPDSGGADLSLLDPLPPDPSPPPDRLKFRCFSLVPAPIFVFLWNFGGVFEGRDPQMCTSGPRGFRAAGVSHDSRELQTRTFEGPGASKNTTKIPREDRQREKKSENGSGRVENTRNFGPPTLQGPTLRGPPFGARPSGPDFFWVWGLPAGPPPTRTAGTPWIFGTLPPPPPPPHLENKIWPNLVWPKLVSPARVGANISLFFFISHPT